MISSRYLLEPLPFYSSVANNLKDRVGEISEDRSAVIGRQDWCFIYEGSNNYRASYMDTDLHIKGKDWARLIETRQRYCDERHIQFLQIIVPNKATLLPHYFPDEIISDTSFPLLGLLSSSINANLLIPVEEFRLEAIRESIYRRNDSHLTVAGNAYLAELIVDALGFSTSNVEPVQTQETRHTGDLGVKFIQQISEQCHVPRWDAGLLDQGVLEKLLDVSNFGFVGIEQYFRNSRPYIKKKILVIGNSFFERVPGWGVSPFFAALFEEFIFFWSPHMDSDVVERVRPDIVVAQTCERFMNILPLDTIV